MCWRWSSVKKRRKWITYPATAMVALATVWPFLFGFSEHVFNEAISWFWASVALFFVLFVIVAMLEWSDQHQWSKARTFLLAIGWMLLALDTVRIRIDLAEEWINPGASTPFVWGVRIFCGWATVAFFAFRATRMTPDEHAPV